MLTITPNAAHAITAILEAEQVPEGSGLRISARSGETATQDGGAQLELALVEEPESDDEVVEEQGAQVFVEAEAARILDDKQLDAILEGERIGFRVLDQDAPDASADGNGGLA